MFATDIKVPIKDIKEIGIGNAKNTNKAIIDLRFSNVSPSLKFCCRLDRVH